VQDQAHLVGQWAAAAGAVGGLKRPEIRVLFTIASENIEYTEGLGEFVVAPIDISELVAMVTKLISK
jgi:hypothetical protein